MVALSKTKHKTWLKIKKSVSVLCDGFVIILLGLGHTEHSLGVLIARVGISTIMNSIDAFINPVE